MVARADATPRSATRARSRRSCRPSRARSRKARRISVRLVSASPAKTSAKPKPPATPRLMRRAAKWSTRRDAGRRDVRQPLDGATHVRRHEEGEIGGAPEGGQPEDDLGATALDREALDEPHGGDGFVELRIHHGVERRHDPVPQVRCDALRHRPGGLQLMQLHRSRLRRAPAGARRRSPWQAPGCGTRPAHRGRRAAPRSARRSCA